VQSNLVPSSSIIKKADVFKSYSFALKSEQELKLRLRNAKIDKKRIFNFNFEMHIAGVNIFNEYIIIVISKNNKDKILI